MRAIAGFGTVLYFLIAGAGSNKQNNKVLVNREVAKPNNTVNSDKK